MTNQDFRTALDKFAQSHPAEIEYAQGNFSSWQSEFKKNVFKLRIDTKTKSHFLLPGSLCSWHDGVVPLSKRIVVDHG